MIRDNGHNHDSFFGGLKIPDCPACERHWPGECSAKCTNDKHVAKRPHTANLAECWCEPVKPEGGGVMVHRWA